MGRRLASTGAVGKRRADCVIRHISSGARRHTSSSPSSISSPSVYRITGRGPSEARTRPLYHLWLPAGEHHCTSTCSPTLGLGPLAGSVVVVVVVVVAEAAAKAGEPLPFALPLEDAVPLRISVESGRPSSSSDDESSSSVSPISNRVRPGRSSMSRASVGASRFTRTRTAQQRTEKHARNRIHFQNHLPPLFNIHLGRGSVGT